MNRNLSVGPQMVPRTLNIHTYVEMHSIKYSVQAIWLVLLQGRLRPYLCPKLRGMAQCSTGTVVRLQSNQKWCFTCNSLHVTLLTNVFTPF